MNLAEVFGRLIWVLIYLSQSVPERETIRRIQEVVHPRTSNGGTHIFGVAITIWFAKKVRIDGVRLKRRVRYYKRLYELGERSLSLLEVYFLFQLYLSVFVTSFTKWAGKKLQLLNQINRNNLNSALKARPSLNYGRRNQYSEWNLKKFIRF